MSAKRKFWVAGLVVATVGVVLARVVPRQIGQPGIRVVLFGLGVLLAFAGLALIMAGIKKT